MKKLALVHTAPFLVAVFKDMLAKRYPDLDSFHMVDESLIQDARRDGGMTPAITRRIAGLCGLAQDAGAEVILFTCSSTSQAVDPVRPLMNVPILKIDDAMAAKAVRMGSKIGLLCTSQTTAIPSTQILQDHANQAGRDISVELVIENEAYFALRKRRQGRTRPHRQRGRHAAGQPLRRDRPGPSVTGASGRGPGEDAQASGSRKPVPLRGGLGRHADRLTSISPCNHIRRSTQKEDRHARASQPPHRFSRPQDDRAGNRGPASRI